MTAHRAKESNGGHYVAGRAATLNGRAAGDNPGWEGGSVVRRYLTTYECARVLGVSTRTVPRIAHAHRQDTAEHYHEGKRRHHRLYDAQAIYELARARGSNLCQMCGTPTRPHAYTCGRSSCVCAAYRQRRAAYEAVRP